MKPRHVLFGALFGFILVRIGATEFDAIRDMFLLRDLHLAIVIGLGIAVSAVGFTVLRRTRARSMTGEPLALQAKPMQPGLVTGSLLFGIGWALSGTCPGTALAQIGHGQLAGLATFAGILAGAWLYERRARVAVRRRVEATAAA